MGERVGFLGPGQICSAGVLVGLGAEAVVDGSSNGAAQPRRMEQRHLSMLACEFDPGFAIARRCRR